MYKKKRLETITDQINEEEMEKSKQELAKTQSFEDFELSFHFPPLLPKN